MVVREFGFWGGITPLPLRQMSYVKISNNDDIYVTLLINLCLHLGLAPSGPLHNYDCLAPATTLSSALSKISYYFYTIHSAERLAIHPRIL